jgi:hypothetical protein
MLGSIRELQQIERRRTARILSTNRAPQTAKPHAEESNPARTIKG